MGVFKDADEAAAFIGRIWELLADDPEVGPKLAATGLVLRGIYTDPVYQVTIVCSEGSIKVVHGETDIQSDAALLLTGDMGHHFWLGAVNTPDGPGPRPDQGRGEDERNHEGASLPQAGLPDLSRPPCP